MSNRGVFSAVMYWAPHRETDDALAREHFRKIRDTGFDTIRIAPPSQVLLPDEGFQLDWPARWLDAAADFGLSAIVHAFEVPAPHTLAALGVTEADWPTLYADSEAYIALMDTWVAPVAQRFADHPALRIWAGPGEPPPGQGRLVTDEDRRRFAAYLEAQYGDIERLDHAWNICPALGYRIAENFEHATRLVDGFDVDPTVNGVHRAKLNHGAGRDLLRFLTDARLDKARVMVDRIRAEDPNHPVYLGAHQLFANNPQWIWDNAELAKIADGHGVSMHLSWHFERVDGEIDRPAFIMARMARDAAKAAPTAVWEATGGPVQFSGGFGNHMSPALMRRLSLACLAAGHTGLGYWTWNTRPGGWEVNEYGLLGRDGEPTSWAHAAGQIATAMQRYAEELAAASTPANTTADVGILMNWDSEAVYCFEPPRHDHDVRQMPRDAWVGAARALTNMGVPFAFIDAAELLADPVAAAGSWPRLLATHLRSVDDALLVALEAYVQAGGRLVADVSFALLDRWGKLRPKPPQWLGARLNAIHDTRTQSRLVQGVPIDGFYGDLAIDDPQTQVIACFDDASPAAALTMHGQGAVVTLAFDPALMCLKPGRSDVERLLIQLIDPTAQNNTCPIFVHHRTSPQADHVFLINPGPTAMATVVRKHPGNTDITNVLTGESLSAMPSHVQVQVQVPAEDAVWIRLANDIGTV